MGSSLELAREEHFLAQAEAWKLVLVTHKEEILMGANSQALVETRQERVRAGLFNWKVVRVDKQELVDVFSLKGVQVVLVQVMVVKLLYEEEMQ